MSLHSLAFDRPNAQRQYKTVPIVPGAVYYRKDVNTGTEEFGTMQCVRIEANGKATGELTLLNRGKIVVREGTEAFAQWSLYSEPQPLDTPIQPEIIDEISEITKENERLRKEAEDMKNMKLALDVIRLKQEGKKWSEIAKDLDVPWQTAKKLYAEYMGSAPDDEK